MSCSDCSSSHSPVVLRSVAVAEDVGEEVAGAEDSVVAEEASAVGPAAGVEDSVAGRAAAVEDSAAEHRVRRSADAVPLSADRNYRVPGGSVPVWGNDRARANAPVPASNLHSANGPARGNDRIQDNVPANGPARDNDRVLGSDLGSDPARDLEWATVLVSFPEREQGRHAVTSAIFWDSRRIVPVPDGPASCPRVTLATMLAITLGTVARSIPATARPSTWETARLLEPVRSDGQSPIQDLDTILTGRDTDRGTSPRRVDGMLVITTTTTEDIIPGITGGELRLRWQ